MEIQIIKALKNLKNTNFTEEELIHMLASNKLAMRDIANKWVDARGEEEVKKYSDQAVMNNSIGTKLENLLRQFKP